MLSLFRSTKRRGVVSSRIGSLLLLFQRSPIVQMLFPEARVLGGAGLAEFTKWSVATVAGLGAFDTVAGATVISQISPNEGSSTVPATYGSNLTFVFQITGAPHNPGSWSVTGSLPAGLSLVDETKNDSSAWISGTPTQAGSFQITVRAWKYADTSGGTFSKNFTINVAPIAPQISNQPDSVTINSGQTTTLTVNATGGSLSYQWYRGSSGNTANLIAGATGPSFTTPTLTANTSYWVQVTNSAGTKNSSTATVTVQTPPAFTSQPDSATINSGQTATLTVAASGSPAPTFQWYRGSSGNTANLIAGATGSSFTTPALTVNTSYWVRASNAVDDANSSTATVTVQTPPAFNNQPASTTINSGQTATLTVTASGSPTPTFQWYRGSSGNTANLISGATGASFTTPALTTNTSYWVRASNAAGNANSNTATVTVRIPPAFTSQPASTTINSGETATFTVAASGTSPTFQWYRGASGVTTNLISGATGSSFTTPALSASTSYWVRATNGAGTADSSTGTATVNTPFTTWRESQFSQEAAADESTSGPSADPDGDGLTNRQEYIFGQRPLSPDASPLPTPARSSGQISLGFTALKTTGQGYAGLTRHYALEAAETLDSASWTALTGHEDIVGNDQPVSYTAPATAPRQFYRLSVWLTP